jgi:hypothetical protein
MEDQTDVRIIAAERLTDGIVVKFEDGSGETGRVGGPDLQSRTASDALADMDERDELPVRDPLPPVDEDSHDYKASFLAGMDARLG